MRILVIADTHSPPHRIPTAIFELAAKVDLTLHAGDINTLETLTQLRLAGPVAAVWGNNDVEELRSRLPERYSLTISGVRIEMIHGHQDRTAVATARAVAREVRVPGVVVFGHSHDPVLEEARGILLLNPGSPSAMRFTRGRTYGLLTVENGTVRPELVDLTVA